MLSLASLNGFIGVAGFRNLALPADQRQGETIVFLVVLRVIVRNGVTHAHHHGQARRRWLDLWRLVRNSEKLGLLGAALGRNGRVLVSILHGACRCRRFGSEIRNGFCGRFIKMRHLGGTLRIHQAGCSRRMLVVLIELSLELLTTPEVSVIWRFNVILQQKVLFYFINSAIHAT